MTRVFVHRVKFGETQAVAEWLEWTREMSDEGRIVVGMLPWGLLPDVPMFAGVFNDDLVVTDDDVTAVQLKCTFGNAIQEVEITDKIADWVAFARRSRLAA